MRHDGLDFPDAIRALAREFGVTIRESGGPSSGRIAALYRANEAALEFFRQLREKVASADGLPPLGTHILMGESAGQKVSNMLQCISDEIIAPVQIIAKMRG